MQNANLELYIHIYYHVAGRYSFIFQYTNSYFAGNEVDGDLKGVKFVPNVRI